MSTDFVSGYSLGLLQFLVFDSQSQQCFSNCGMKNVSHDDPSSSDWKKTIHLVTCPGRGGVLGTSSSFKK